MSSNQCTIGVPDIDPLIENWMKWDRNEQTRAQVTKLVQEKNVDRLRAIMCGRPSFGTAGMRAEMAAGFNRLNDLVIIQTTQGMLKYMQTLCPKLNTNGVIVGYDARHNSERFAHLVANVFIRAGVKVYLFSKIVPTPFVSYGVVKYGCDAGIMVTASHNPSEDNGYKAYWSNGAQILAPHDVGISEHASREQEPWPNAWDTSIINSSPLRLDPLTELTRIYFDDARGFSLYKEYNEKSSLKITYTAFHGVGSLYTPNLITDVFKFPKDHIVYVKEQIAPDPNFPTVKFPNPEEGATVLALSFKTADQNGSTLILANDPDADRLQIAEKQKDGKWRVFTGNEMGGLLTWWRWHCWRKVNPTADPSSVYVINSAVSSKISASIAKKEGFNCEQTLTGFKWMGNRTEQLRREGKTVLLAWEESIGYMPGNTLDKDGVLAAALFSEYAAYLEHNQMTFSDQLNYLYQTYGYHLGCISYFINHDPVITKRMFDRIRNFDGNGYCKRIGHFAVKHVRDLTEGYDNSQPNNKPVLPVSKSTEMITFTLETGSVVTLRTSGTEPKIKYYIEVVTDPNSKGGEPEAAAQLKELVKATIDDLVQPDVHKIKQKEE